MSLAIATMTAPRDWWHETDETIATAIRILEEQREEVERRGK